MLTQADDWNADGAKTGKTYEVLNNTIDGLCYVYFKHDDLYNWEAKYKGVVNTPKETISVTNCYLPIIKNISYENNVDLVDNLIVKESYPAPSPSLAYWAKNSGKAPIFTATTNTNMGYGVKTASPAETDHLQQESVKMFLYVQLV